MSYKRISPQPVVEGGTGAQTLTSHAVLLGNGTSAIGVVAVGTTGQVLTGVTGSAPTFQAAASSSISITGDSGGALTGAAFTFTGGSTGLTFAGAGSTETLGGTLAIANGGTNATSFTQSNGIVTYNGTRLVNYAGPQISSGGVSTNTSQPAFSAYLSATDTNVLGAGSAYTLGSGNVLTIIKNQGSGLTTGGVFTAPVSGFYFLTAIIGLSGNSALYNTNDVSLVIAGTSANGFESDYNYGSSQTYLTMSISTVAYMTANDTCKVKANSYISSGGGSNIVSVAGTVGVTYFAGYLVC